MRFDLTAPPWLSDPARTWFSLVPDLGVRRNVAKQDDVVKVQGTVLETLPNAMFKVEIEGMGHDIPADLAMAFADAIAALATE